MKKINKLLANVLLTTSFLGVVSPVVTYADQVNYSYEVNEQSSNVLEINGNGNFTVNGVVKTYSEQDRVSQLGQKLEKYFYLDNSGNVKFSATQEKLTNELGISVEEANLIMKLSEDLPNLYDRGFVGLTLHLGPTVRGMTGFAAGTFAAGYCGWYLKQFAVSPVTAGVVAVISGSIGGAVGWAVTNGLRSVDVGVNVPATTMRFNVYVP